MPSAAEVLPLPVPVLTIRRPFSPVLVAMILSRAALCLRAFSSCRAFSASSASVGIPVMRFPSARVGKSSAIRSAARLERGVHSPRRIASAKRSAVSRSAAGLAVRHEVSYALVFQIGSEQLIEMMIGDRVGRGRKAEQIIHRRGDLEGALVAVAHHAGDPFRIGGAAAHHARDFVAAAAATAALPGAKCRCARSAARGRARSATVAASPPMN